MTTKFSQKVKIAKQSGQLFSSLGDTIKFLANGLTIYLAAYITKHVTCGRPIYPPNKQKNSPLWGIGQKLCAMLIIPHDSSRLMLKT